MNTHENASTESLGRLLARLVRVLLDRAHYETLADLTDALKWECARLRIRWTNDDINDAYRLIESNRPLPGTPTAPANQQHVERPADVVPISRAEATDFLRRLNRAGLDIRTVPAMAAVRRLEPHDLVARQWRADRHRALQLVQQQILETAQRVARLEAEIEPVDQEQVP